MQYATLCALLSTTTATTSLPVDDAVMSLGVLEEGVMSLAAAKVPEVNKLGEWTMKKKCKAATGDAGTVADAADAAACLAKCAVKDDTKCAAVYFDSSKADLKKNCTMYAKWATVGEAGADADGCALVSKGLCAKDTIDGCPAAVTKLTTTWAAIFTAEAKYDTDNKDKKLTACDCDGTKTDDKLKVSTCSTVKDCGTSKTCFCSSLSGPADALLSSVAYPATWCMGDKGDSVVPTAADAKKFYTLSTAQVATDKAGDKGAMCTGATRLYASVAMIAATIMMY